MKFSCKKIYLLTIICIFSLPAVLPAQKGAWVHYDVGFSYSGTVFDAVGENCLIYGFRDSSLILGFDIFGHKWHTFRASSAFSFGSITRAGEFTAMIYNDSLAVAYSAETHSFAELKYEGDLVSDVDAAGCSGYMAFLLTTAAFYVFDASSASWFTHFYTPLEPAGEGVAMVLTAQDYLIATLANAATTDQFTVAAFSHHTNSFDELHGMPFTIKLLEHGYAIYRDAAEDSEDYFGGYSVYTGEHLIIKPNRDIFTGQLDRDWNTLRPRTVFMYHYDSEIVENQYTRYMYAFDTYTGALVGKEAACTYLNDGTHPIRSYSGGETGFFTFWDEGGNEEISFITYDGTKHTFATYNSPLVFHGYNLPFGDEAGGSILTSYNPATFLGYNIPNGTPVTAALPLPTDQQLLVQITSKNDWSFSSFRRGAQDSVTVYSYHGANNNLQQFRAKYSGYITHLEGLNVGCILEREYMVSAKYYLYSPQLDSWRVHDYPTSDPQFEVSRDYILIYTADENEIYLFDGMTGSETAIPFGWGSTYSFTSLHTIINDACVVAFNNDSVLYAYSTHTRNLVNQDYKRDFGLRFGQKDIIVFYWSMGDYRDYLAYNSLYNCFVPMSLEAYGTSRTHRGGGKTALVTTRSGHLLAFDPYLDTPPNTLEESGTTGISAAMRFDLEQNFPNPFNPVTTIRYRVAFNSHISLQIFNILGQRVRTVIDGEQTAGPQSVQWDGRSDAGAALSSGVYFYQLTAPGFLKTRKMLLLR